MFTALFKSTYIFACEIRKNFIFAETYPIKHLKVIPPMPNNHHPGIGNHINNPACYKNITMDECYPFLMADKDLYEEYPIREFNAEIENQIFAIAGNVDGCEENGLCFCSDNMSPPKSHYLKPVSCISPITDSTVLEECELQPTAKFIQEVEGCNGDRRCYRLNSQDEMTLIITKKRIDSAFGNNTITKSYINELNSNNRGVCLPTATCVPQKLSIGMTLRKEDKCEDSLVEIGEHPDRLCADQALANIVEKMPHEIKFSLDPDSCEIKGFEYNKKGELIYDPLGIREREKNTSGLVYVGEAEQIIKNSPNKDEVSFYPGQENVPDDQKLKIISVTDYKNMTFSKVLRGMEWLWGQASSDSMNLNWLTSNRVKLHLGKQAKGAFQKYQVSRRLSEIIQTIETKKIFDVVQEEVDPEAEPLAAVKSQILSLEVYQKLLHVELLGLRDLLGGKDFWDSVNSDSFDKSSNKDLFTHFKNDPDYENSLAYLKNASGSLSSGLWNRRTDGKPKCPWTDGCAFKDCNGDKVYCKDRYTQECEKGDDTFNMDLSGTNGGHKYLIRLCAEEEIKISDIVQHGKAFNGSLVNAFYPKSLTVGAKGSKFHIADGYEFSSMEKLIENMKTGLKQYTNRNMQPLSNDPVEQLENLSEFQIAQNYIEEYNNFDDLPALSYNSGEINNMINGEYSCAFGSNLKHVNLKFTAEEYLVREKNEGLNSPVSLQLTQGEIINLREENNKDDKNPLKFDELLNDSSVDYLSRTMVDIFIKMHFTMFQEQWRNDGSSGLLGGAGFWRNASGTVDFKTDWTWGTDAQVGDKDGQTLGYIDEIYLMVEYMYKYRAGLLDGFGKQLTCLKEKVTVFEEDFKKASDDKKFGTQSVADQGQENIDETNKKIKDFITVQDRLNEITNACEVVKVDVAPTNSGAVPTPNSSVPLPGGSGFVDFNPGDQEGLVLGKGKNKFNNNGNSFKNKLKFGNFGVGSTAGINGSVGTGKDSVSQGNTGKGSVAGGTGSKNAKSSRDGVKKILKGLNKLNEARNNLYSKVKQPSKISTDNILASVFRPNTVNASVTTALKNSFKETDLNKKVKASPNQTEVKKKSKNNRRGKSFRSKRKKKGSGKRVINKHAKRNKRILRAIKMNPNRYNSLEKDSIFTRVSKAIVRHGYPILLDEQNYDVELPSSKRKLYNSKSKNKFLD